MAYTNRADLNYVGLVYQIGENLTPFLGAVGGLNAGATCSDFPFPLNQHYTLSPGSQPDISEATSVASGTATTVARAQAFNTVQIMKYTVEVSNAKQSSVGGIGGLSQLGVQPVRDEFAWQKELQFKQMALDMNYTFLRGAYQAASPPGTSALSRGLETAITTNEVLAEGAVLTKVMIDDCLAKILASGGPRKDLLLVANSFNIRKINDIYGYAPADRMMGGTAVSTILSPFGTVSVMYDGDMPADEIYIVEMSVCSPMYLPFDGKAISYTDLAKIASSKKGEWYTQVGLDYGTEKFHGSITGTATTA